MNLELLPSEILCYILSLKQLNEHDIINLTSCNHRLHNLLNNSKIWEGKFKLNWQNHHLEINNKNWLETFKLRKAAIKLTRKLLDELAWDYFYKKNVSSTAFENFNQINDNNLKMFINDELYDLATNGDKYHELLYKYYSIMTLTYLIHFEIKNKLLCTNLENLDLEEGILIFTKWFQPTLDQFSLNEISQKMDTIALDIWNTFKSNNPSISFTYKEYLSNINPENSINTTQSLELMKTISFVLYKVYKFKWDFEDQSWTKNSFLNEVLIKKKGLPVILAVLFRLLAKRLKLKCDILDFPKRVIIRYVSYKPPANFYGDINQYPGTYFIDPFDDGKFLNYHELEIMVFADRMLNRSLEESDFKISSTKDVLLRLARNLIANLYSQPENRKVFRCFRYAIEFSLLINPSDFEMRFLLLKLYLYLGVEMEIVMQHLTELSSSGLHDALCKSLIKETRTKLDSDRNRYLDLINRSDPVNVNVLYSVGMIMKHKKYNYDCVIISWDPICLAADEWKRQMNVNNLPNNGEYQPFYHVLVSDGTDRYAAQENLMFPDEPKYVNHPDIGLYFTEYLGTHYIPNPRKRAEYPEDYDFTCETINRNYSPVNLEARLYRLNTTAST